MFLVKYYVTFLFHRVSPYEKSSNLKMGKWFRKNSKRKRGAVNHPDLIGNTLAPSGGQGKVLSDERMSFSLSNSIWFMTGSFLEQGTTFQPRFILIVCATFFVIFIHTL